jgi:hypothetical protein
MKKAKTAGGAALVFMILTCLGYLAMHVYFAYVAFTSFKLWFAILVTILPVGGDMLLLGAYIADGNWLPAIAFTVVSVLYMISSALASAADKRHVA